MSKVSREPRGLLVVVEVDENAIEEGLVHQSLEVLREPSVEVLAAFEEVENLVEVGASFGDVRCERGLLPLDVGEGAADAVLFGLEQLEWDGIGVVRLEQALLLADELVLLFFQGLPVFEGFTAAVSHLVEDRGVDAIAFGWAERDGAVERRDLVLDDVDQNGTHVAGGLLLLAADADEVRVDLAGLGRGVVDEHS
ncbi:hypothetical protein [Microbacterium sp.]|uniref:hypothetical protein n=1 Tax=Microbacterium sp. TaxID=51671 RepID=UPI0025FF936C|nr:hypothetical protein [Microbacterium sp.]